MQKCVLFMGIVIVLLINFSNFVANNNNLNSCEYEYFSERVRRAIYGRRCG